MKTLLFAILLSLSIEARAEIVTLVAYDPLPQEIPLGVLPVKPSVEITSEQSIQLLSASQADNRLNILVFKDGRQMSWNAVYGQVQAPLVVRGPAKLTFSSPQQSGATYATFRITPEAVDPTKTIIVLPGTNNAAKVAMLCSTNLTDWSEATNGIYSGGVAKFFRISLEPVEPKR